MEMAGTFLYDFLLLFDFYIQSKITTMFHDDIITVLSTFSPLFSIKVWNYAQTLLIGAILCNNQRFVLWLSSRTVAAILRVMGLSLFSTPLSLKPHE